MLHTISEYDNILSKLSALRLLTGLDKIGFLLFFGDCFASQWVVSSAHPQ